MLDLGRVATLRRYPVKLMLGGDINESDVTTSGQSTMGLISAPR